MTWTKRTKISESTAAGFLEGLGFLIEGFLESAANKWNKIVKLLDS